MIGVEKDPSLPEHERVDGDDDVPAAGQGGGGRPPGKKPPGGVQNLKWVKNADGSRVMTYEYQGKSYSIAYKPSTTAGCWDFDEQSFTTGGAAQKGTYCRKPW